MGVLGQKGRFWTIFGQKVATFEFSVKKQKSHFFTHFFIFEHKKSENSNFWENGHVTYKRTYERTEVNPKVHRLHRETKNQTIPINQSKEKCENLIFMPF